MFAAFWNWIGTLPSSSASFLGTVTGSALGLCALLIGALFNAHLNRRRDDAIRNMDRKALAAALRAELSSIKDTLTDNVAQIAKDLPPIDGSFVIPDLMHSSIVFEHTLPKIALLAPKTIRQVLDAYIVLAELFDRINLIGEIARKEGIQHRRLMRIPATKAHSFETILRSGLGPVGLAIEALDKEIES
jgi:hypothetical protein